MYGENDLLGHDIVFAKDRTAVYVDDKKLSNADVAGFKVSGENYCSDNKYVFYKTTIVNGANPVNFKVYPHDVGDADAEDAANKYLEAINVKSDLDF